MNFSIDILPAAEADIGGILAWITEQADAEAADRYIDRIEHKIAKLQNFPRRGSLRPEFGGQIRSLTFERRYLILYRVDGDVVYITRVLSADRDLRGLTL